MRYLFPQAQIESQRISEFLVEIGKEVNFRLFFENYLDFLRTINPKFNIMVDSTGLANSIKIPLTAINNHNGVISNEIRLIVIADKISGLPIYYRYVPGNIVDVSTLSMIISEMKEYNIDINKAIMDAGYYSEDNIINLYDNKIPFMTRMVERTEKYELILKKFIPDIMNKENFIKYGDRNLFIKKAEINFFKQDIPLNCYICLDIQKQGIDKNNYFKYFNTNKSNEQLQLDELTHGVFILISSIDLEPSEVLPCYYDRQIIEQIIDYMKNYIDIIPLRIHNEEILAGHLLISFMASIVYLSIDKEVKKRGYSLYSAIRSLHRLHCRVYQNKLIPDVSTKAVNDIFKILKIKLPTRILIN
jgi:transposase